MRLNTLPPLPQVEYSRYDWHHPKEGCMRKFVLGFTFVSALAMTAMAAEWSGYISDAGCTTKQGAAKVAADSHAGCAEGCIKGVYKAVVHTPDGNDPQTPNQDY